MDDLHRASIVHAGRCRRAGCVGRGRARRRPTDRRCWMRSCAVTTPPSGSATPLARGITGTGTIRRPAASTGPPSAAGALHGLDAGRHGRRPGPGRYAQSSGLWQCRIEPTHSKQLNTARAAQSGLVAADLARLVPCRRAPDPRGLARLFCRDLRLTPIRPRWSPGRTNRGRSIRDQLQALAGVSACASGDWRHAAPCATAFGADDVAAIEIETYRDAVAFCDQPEPADAPRGALQPAALSRGRLAQRARRGLRTSRRRCWQGPGGCRPAPPGHGRRGSRHSAPLFRRSYGARLDASARERGQRGRPRSTDAKGDPEDPHVARTEIADKARHPDDGAAGLVGHRRRRPHRGLPYAGRGRVGRWRARTGFREAVDRSLSTAANLHTPEPSDEPTFLATPEPSPGYATEAGPAPVLVLVGRRGCRDRYADPRADARAPGRAGGAQGRLWSHGPDDRRSRSRRAGQGQIVRRRGARSWARCRAGW